MRPPRLSPGGRVGRTCGDEPGRPGAGLTPLRPAAILPGWRDRRYPGLPVRPGLASSWPWPPLICSRSRRTGMPPSRIPHRIRRIRPTPTIRMLPATTPVSIAPVRGGTTITLWRRTWISTPCPSASRRMIGTTGLPPTSSRPTRRSGTRSLAPASRPHHPGLNRMTLCSRMPRPAHLLPSGFFREFSGSEIPSSQP